VAEQLARRIALPLLKDVPRIAASADKRETGMQASMRRVRIGEMVLLYLAGPVLLYWLVYVRHVPLLLILPFVFAGLITVLLRQKDRSWRSVILRLPRRRDILSILGLFLIFGGALTLYAYERFPDSFLALPAGNTRLWLLIMIFYPLISVTTQELIYRVLYFDRYAPAIEGPSWLPVALNGALFAIMHGVLFAYRSQPFHWEAVAISLMGGLLFAYRFVRTRSFLAVALEHALYGDLIFTVGLGRFFFTGVSHL
jgi:hypothetical protein